jgi:hypothetical protein
MAPVAPNLLPRADADTEPLPLSRGRACPQLIRHEQQAQPGSTRADLRMLPKYVRRARGHGGARRRAARRARHGRGAATRPGPVVSLSIVTHGRKAANRAAATHSCTVKLAPIQRDNVVGTGPHYLRAANRDCLGLALHDRAGVHVVRWPRLRRVPTQVADQSDDVFRYESPDLATPLALTHKEGRTARCRRVLTYERG